MGGFCGKQSVLISNRILRFDSGLLKAVEESAFINHRIIYLRVAEVLRSPRPRAVIPTG